MAIVKAVGVKALVSSDWADLLARPVRRTEAARLWENWRRFISHLHALSMG
jgi:hypothetical protein